MTHRMPDAPRRRSLEPGIVEIWSAPLDLPAHRIAHLWTLLGADERKRADRFRQRRDATRFIARRGWLRLALSRYAAVAPERLELTADAGGKPRLAGSLRGISFSASHSGDLALLAVALDADVGIDVEGSDPPLDWQALASVTLTAVERAEVARQPDERRGLRWLELWLRKEAYLKAIGEGLARDPREVETCRLEPGGILRGSDGRPWSLWEFAPSDRHLACLVVEGGSWQVRGVHEAQSLT